MLTSQGRAALRKAAQMFIYRDWEVFLYQQEMLVQEHVPLAGVCRVGHPTSCTASASAGENSYLGSGRRVVPSNSIFLVLEVKFGAEPALTSVSINEEF